MASIAVSLSPLAEITRIGILRVVAVDPFVSLEAGFIRQHHVQNDYVGIGRRHGGQPLFGGTGGFYRHVRSLEEPPKDIQNGLIIIDDEQSRHRSSPE